MKSVFKVEYVESSVNFSVLVIDNFVGQKYFSSKGLAIELFSSWGLEKFFLKIILDLLSALLSFLLFLGRE